MSDTTTTTATTAKQELTPEQQAHLKQCMESVVQVLNIHVKGGVPYPIVATAGYMAIATMCYGRNPAAILLPALSENMEANMRQCFESSLKHVRGTASKLLKGDWSL